MADLGGTIDVLASFLTTEDLLFCLVDQPKEIKRLVDEVSALWMQIYNEINEIIKDQQGFSDWGSIFSEKPSYMLQCDFCYMIGPEMFDEFVRDDLDGIASQMEKPFYHLDGIGELPHLESLLSIDSIKGIQWIPGAGNPLKQDWSNLYKRISQAGKKIQGYNDIDPYLDGIIKVLEKPDDFIKMQQIYPSENKQEILGTLSKYGA